MPNIVHFGKYYFPETGGIESVTSSTARGAARAGHRVSVICFQTGTAATHELIDGVHLHRARLSRLVASQPLGWQYLRWCLSEGRRAEIVHLHAPNMLAALCALLLPQRVGVLVHWHSDVVGKGWLGRLLRPLEQALLKRARGIIATSPVYARASAALAPHIDKVTIVPIGAPIPLPPRSRQVLPEQLAKLLDGKRLILSVGRLVHYKGFDVLVNAAHALPDDAVVLIVGGGPLHAELQAAIRAAGVEHRVHLTGRLDCEVLTALFEQASLYCLPSRERSEAFGVVLLEAMAYGLPIVATQITGSGVPWVNQHDVSGINVRCEDPQALAEACNQILSSEEEHTRLGNGARQRFFSEFTEEVFVQRTLTLYEQLLKTPAAA